MANSNEFLDSIVTDPGNRAGVMQTVNTGLANQYKAGERLNQRIDENQKLLDDILVSTEVRKAEFQQETAQMVSQATTDMDRLLEERTRDYTNISQSLANTTRELYALNQRATDPNATSKERRQAAKDFNELNVDARRLEEMRVHAAQRMQTLANSRTTVAKTVEDSRNYRQQAEFDTVAFAEAARLEKLNKRLDTRRIASQQNTSNLAQLRTLNQGEAGTQEYVDTMNSYRSAYKIMNRGQNMEQFGEAAAKTTAARMQSLSPAQQVALTPARLIIERAEAQGEDLSWNDVRGILISEGRLDTLQVVAEVSGDTALQDIVQDGVNDFVASRRLARTAEVLQLPANSSSADISKALADADPAQLEQIMPLVEQDLANAYARDVVTARQGAVATEASANVQSAGADIYNFEAEEMPINLAGLPADVQAVFTTDEFKSALTRADLSTGDAQIGVTQQLMQVFSNSGINEVDAANAVAEFNRGAALSWLRNRNSAATEVIDTLSVVGRPTTNGLMIKQLPAGIRRYVSESDGVAIQQSYDTTDGSDILAMLEVLRAANRNKTESREALRRTFNRNLTLPPGQRPGI